MLASCRTRTQEAEVLADQGRRCVQGNTKDTPLQAAGAAIRALYRRHASHPRNPLLAGAVFRTRLIEQWGTGTLRIIDACRPHGIAVEFEQDMGMSFGVTPLVTPPRAFSGRPGK